MIKKINSTADGWISNSFYNYLLSYSFFFMTIRPLDDFFSHPCFSFLISLSYFESFITTTSIIRFFIRFCCCSKKSTPQPTDEFLTRFITPFYRISVFFNDNQTHEWFLLSSLFYYFWVRYPIFWLQPVVISQSNYFRQNKLIRSISFLWTTVHFQSLWCLLTYTLSPK